MNTLEILQLISVSLSLAEQAQRTAARLSARLEEAHANPDDPSKQVTAEEIASARAETDAMVERLKAKLAVADALAD